MMARTYDGTGGYFVSDPDLVYRVEPLAGAYVLTHRLTGLFYIGSTGDLYKRRGEHESLLRNGSHTIARLQEAYNQSPIVDLVYWFSADREEALRWEQSLLNQNWGNPLLLNTGLNAHSPQRGREATDRQREMASLTHRGKTVAEDSKEKMKQARLAFEASPEGKALREKLSIQKQKRVSINGVIYSSSKEAAEKLGLTLDMVAYRVSRSQNYRPTWFYCDEYGNRLP